MKTYKLHFIRHGLTEGNKQGYYVGTKDLPVCDEGIMEINKILEEADYPYIDKLYTSPMVRCRQTAGLIYPNMKQNVIEEMREMNFGDFEGRTYKELQEDETYVKWLENSLENTPPHGETTPEFLDRLLKGLGKIFSDMMENGITSAALVTHGGVMMNLFAAIGLPKKKISEWLCPNAFGYTVFLTPQMWMRDNAIEIFDTLPKAKENPDEI